jgi:acetyl-CoA carboxylase/biotin carboxylase 1
MAYQLELCRLRNFSVTPIVNMNHREFHVYFATTKGNPSECQIFIRALVRPQKLQQQGPVTDSDVSNYIIAEIDRVMQDAMDVLEITLSSQPSANCNHLFFNFIPLITDISSDCLIATLTHFANRHNHRLAQLRVTTSEIRLVIQPVGSDCTKALRFYLNNVSGYVMHMEGMFN